jgi:hemoglobin/transferrin/lactoferrin receptor protein
MKIILLPIVLGVFLFVQTAFSQLAIEGRVIDSYTGEGIERARISVPEFSVEVFSQADGRFSLTGLKDTSIVISIERIGYKEFSEKINSIPAFVKVNGKDVVFSLEQSQITSGTIDVYEGRIETELKYATLPVALVTEQDIKGLPFIAVPNAIEMKTGINLLRDGVWANEISIRGLSRDNVITLINGNRIETANNHAGRLALIDLNTIERIEFIKGGTSSIYGSGAMGGIVNIITKTGIPGSRTSLTGTFSGSYSGVNELSSLNLSLQFNLPDFYLNSYLSTRNASDMTTPSGTIPNSSFRDNGIHLDAGVKLSMKSLLKATFENFNSPFAGIPGGNPVFPDKSKTTYLNANRTMADMTFELKDISKSFSKFSARLFYQAIDREVEVIPNSIVTVPPTNTTPKRVINNVSIYPSGFHDVGGALVQSEFLLSKSSRLVAGIDTWMRKLKTERERTQIIKTFDSLNNITSTNEVITADVPVPESDYRSAGIFLQSQTSFLKEKVFLDLSGRVDAIFISNEETISPVYTITNGIKNSSPAGQKIIWPAMEENDFSWSAGAGANYRLDNEWNIHANISASYRSPGLEERYQYIDLGSTVRLGNPALKPERGYFVSSGVKYWGKTFNFGVEGFGNFLNNLVVEVPGTYEGRSALIKENVGTSQIAGLDADFEYNVVPSLTFLGGATYVSGRNTESDVPLPQIVPLNGRLGLNYFSPFGVKFSLNSIIYSRQDQIASGEFETPGYAVFHFYANYSWLLTQSASLGISAGVENIFDRNYRSHLSTARGSVTAEPGRNAFINLSINYK